jgi:hypothetical protein
MKKRFIEFAIDVMGYDEEEAIELWEANGGDLNEIFTQKELTEFNNY